MRLAQEELVDHYLKRLLTSGQLVETGPGLPKHGHSPHPSISAYLLSVIYSGMFWVRTYFLTRVVL